MGWRRRGWRRGVGWLLFRTTDSALWEPAHFHTPRPPRCRHPAADGQAWHCHPPHPTSTISRCSTRSCSSSIRAALGLLSYRTSRTTLGFCTRDSPGRDDGGKANGSRTTCSTSWYAAYGRTTRLRALNSSHPQGEEAAPELLENFADRLLSAFTKKELSIDNWDPLSERSQDLKVSQR